MASDKIGFRVVNRVFTRAILRVMIKFIRRFTVTEHISVTYADTQQASQSRGRPFEVSTDRRDRNIGS